MNEFPLELSEIKLALKRKGLNYKLDTYEPEDGGQETLIFSDVARGTKLRGKVVRSFNEGEVYYWPKLNHENIVFLLDVLSIRDDLNIFLTADLQTKLKNIVHDKDFMYDSKCFELKRTYARGIFSGLSYLHGKFLCLMNLSDENIFICNSRAVIANFSCLIYSRRTTRSELKVCEIYRAPETEKGDFDAMEAEIWASGTLMLDLFLAHMVPWAVINYKPKRIAEIVDKLSIMPFKAANAGSLVTTSDLTQFKDFLRCFFKENPCQRITARYACIATFLNPEFKNATVRMSIARKIPCSDIKCKGRTHFISCNRSELPVFSQTNEKHDSVTSRDLSKQCLPLKDFDSEQKHNIESETPKWLVPNFTVFTPNGSKGDKSICCFSDTERPLEKYTFRSNKGESIETKISDEGKNSHKLYQLTVEPNHDFDENDNIISGIFSRQKKTSKSCHLMEHGANVLDETSYACYQSKSLSFMKPTEGDVKNEIPFQLCLSRNCSFSSVKSLPLKQSPSNSCQKSDFCLNRLFGECESSEEDLIQEGEVTHETWVGSNTRGKKDFKNFHDVSLHDDIKRPVEEVGRLPKESDRNLCRKSDIQHITENIILLEKCEVSLQDQFRVFSDEEFVQKQRNLTNEYQLLLRQEKIRLYEILRKKHGLNIDEILNIIWSVNSRYRCRRIDSEMRLAQSPRQSTHEHQKSLDCSYVPNWLSRRTYSYRKAIERSRRCKDTERERIPFATENRSEEKLIEKETKWNRSDARVEDDSTAEAIGTAATEEQQKNSTKVKKKRKNRSRWACDHRHQKFRRPCFFFSLCPGGKVEERSSPVEDELCETCKLNH